MQEIIDQVLEEIRGAWRFRRQALIAAWVLAIIGWAYVFTLPDVYQASTRVFVDTKTALKPVLQGLTIDQDVNAQLNLVRNSLLTGPQLESVAEEVGLLNAGIKGSQERLSVVNGLRSRIDLQVSLASQGEGYDREGGSIYAIQYKDLLRERSIKVVEILQTRLIENTLGGKRLGSESAQRFLGNQIREYEERLRLAEDRLAEFKKQNVGLMPNEQGGYFQRLQGEMDAVSKTQSLLSVATSRRQELDRQLRGESPVAAATSLSGNANSGRTGDTLSRINETQSRLDELLLRFTDKHPDVVAARENLEQLKERRAAELDALRRGDPSAAAAGGASANPVYQNIQLQLNQADVEIASLRRALADHQNRVAELRKLLDTMPQVEAEHARLNRDYDVTKANYTALVERLEKSKLGDEAASSGSVRFDVIEPPSAGFTPVSPQRSLLIVGILAAAVAAGAGIAYLMHQLKPVYTSARALAESTGLQVLGAISMSWVDRRRTENRRVYLRYSVAVVALLVVAVGVLQLSRMGIRLSSFHA
jgi:polysaccharide chain length determinant protein (PEP-CTERM system associated)